MVGASASIGRSPAARLFEWANTGFLLILVLLTVYPLVYVAFASISDPTRIVSHQGILLHPLGFTMGAYDLVFRNPMIVIGYRNTLFYLFAGTTLNLLLTSFGAYGLSRKGLFFRNHFMFAITFTMFFQGGLIPLFLLVRTLGMVNTRAALVIPAAISAWNLIIMRTSFQAIPDSLEESAKIDGANDFTILFKIVLPLSMPVVAVMILFYGVHHWNAWFHAMLFLRKRDLYPLQIVLREILIANSTDEMMASVETADEKEPIGETIKYATIMVATVPILLVYPMLQKYFVRGVMVGAIKG